MPLPADLSALTLLSRAFAPLLAIALAAASAAGADAGPAKPHPRPAAKAAPGAASLEASALTAQGQRVSGEVRFSSGALVVGASTIALDALVALDLPGERPSWFDQAVVLADGQVLRGTPRALQQDKLEFAVDLVGTRSLPIEAIAAVVLSPVPANDPLGGIGGFTGAVLANGDRIGGSVSFINESDVGVDTGRKLAKIPRARVKLLCLRPVAPTPGLWLRTAGGDRVRATAGADCFLVQVGADDALKLPLQAIRAAWSEGPQLAPLERLAPATTTRVPQFDEDFPVSIGRFRDGSPLVIGDRPIERGIACHSGCELAWTDLGAYSALVGEVGVADGPGLAICRIVVDGKTAFDSGALIGGAAPKPFSVSINGAHEVKLVADAGPGGETAGDRVVWGSPTLVK